MSKRIEFIDVINLEQELNSITFKGIPIGGSLQKFYLSLLNPSEFGKLSSLGYFLGIIKQLVKILFFIFKRRIGVLESLNEKPKIIITHLNNKQHFNGLVEPLLNYYEKKIILFSFKTSEHSTDTHIIFGNDLIPFKKDVGIVLIKTVALLKKVYAFKKSHGISSKALLIVIYQGLRQFSRISFWVNYLADTQVKMVICEYDRNEKYAPLVLGAKSLGIKTITLTHGVINPPYGYTPVLADKILVWGYIQRDQLLKMDTTSDKIEIVGCPFIEKFKLPSKEKTFSKLSLKNKPTICLALNPIGESLNDILIRVFLSAFQSSEHQYNLIVKLHPSQKKQTFNKWIKKSKDLIFFDNSDITKQELFAITSLLLLHNSGLANEAVLNHIPLLIMDVIDFPLGNGKMLIKQGGILYVKNSQELSKQAKLFLFNKKEMALYQEKLSMFIPEFYKYTGNEASSKTISFIEHIIK